jgi:hypothetical protein
MSAGPGEDLLHTLDYRAADCDEWNVESSAVVDEHVMDDAIGAAPESRRFRHVHAIRQNAPRLDRGIRSARTWSENGVRVHFSW